jgi:hypothetical protein
MNVIVENQEVAMKRLELGDVIVEKSGDAYLVINASVGEYVARSFGGYTGFSGRHNSLEALTESIKGLTGVKVYRKDEYDLKLVEKK